MMKKDVQKMLIVRIDQLCKEKGLSYYTLSYKATIPMTTLLNIMEGNTQNPGVFTIKRTVFCTVLFIVNFIHGCYNVT